MEKNVSYQSIGRLSIQMMSFGRVCQSNLLLEGFIFSWWLKFYSLKPLHPWNEAIQTVVLSNCQLKDVHLRAHASLLLFWIFGFFACQDQKQCSEKELICIVEDFRHFLYSEVIACDLFLAEHLVRIICSVRLTSIILETCLDSKLAELLENFQNQNKWPNGSKIWKLCCLDTVIPGGHG